MSAIFISYRREDAEGHAGRLFADLADRFGRDSVFMDVAGIEPGRDFRKVIDTKVAECGVLLAVMGRNWLDAADGSGARRIDDPADFVRLETASALRRDIPVVPVLVQGAQMPRADQLPRDLGELSYRNAVELTHARWSSDVQLLIEALERLGIPQRQSRRTTSSPEPPAETDAASPPQPLVSPQIDGGGRRRSSALVGMAAAAALLVVGGVAWWSGGPDEDPVAGAVQEAQGVADAATDVRADDSARVAGTGTPDGTTQVPNSAPQALAGPVPDASPEPPQGRARGADPSTSLAAAPGTETLGAVSPGVAPATAAGAPAAPTGSAPREATPSTVSSAAVASAGTDRTVPPAPVSVRTVGPSTGGATVAPADSAVRDARLRELERRNAERRAALQRDADRKASHAFGLDGYRVREADVAARAESPILGSYRQQAGTRNWVEYSPDGRAAFRFTEQNRDEWSVYLWDQQRDVVIQLDLHTRQVNYRQGPNSTFRALYTIVDAR
ncbi:MAG: TIR domain-containing protein [Vicinamibacterales bacterium]